MPGPVERRKRMSTVKWIGLAYGIFLMAGALLGLKAGSKVSLVMGLISGVLVLASVYLMGIKPFLGSSLLAAVSGILTVIFIMRLIQTQKFMPSGMLLAVSAVVLIFTVNDLLRHK